MCDGQIRLLYIITIYLLKKYNYMRSNCGTNLSFTISMASCELIPYSLPKLIPNLGSNSIKLSDIVSTVLMYTLPSSVSSNGPYTPSSSGFVPTIDTMCVLRILSPSYKFSDKNTLSPLSICNETPQACL